MLRDSSGCQWVVRLTALSGYILPENGQPKMITDTNSCYHHSSLQYTVFVAPVPAENQSILLSQLSKKYLNRFRGSPRGLGPEPGRVKVRRRMDCIFCSHRSFQKDRLDEGKKLAARQDQCLRPGLNCSICQRFACRKCMVVFVKAAGRSARHDPWSIIVTD